MSSPIAKWIGTHVFRAITAVIGVAVYVYLWLQSPNTLRWWSRAVNDTVRRGCDLLPDALGARIEPLFGLLGFWAQLALAILVVRIVFGLMMMTRRIGRVGR